MANRKLQGDIDKVLKKVTEGVDDFNGIYDKLQQCTNANQKEKYEQDLKKEIKKLQRLRDQIKAWIASNDVKDKKALLENRKIIETQMERFKACEKEMKVKAFSKEGLNMAEKLDPKEIERRDLIDWVANRIEELNLQIEKLEAEAEKLQGTTKKGRKDTTKLNRFAAVEHYLERQRWHVGRLELINRLLENCIVTNEKSVDFIEAVTSLQDDVQFYVDHNQESDYIEDDEMYSELNLEEEEELFAMADLEQHDSHESVADDSRAEAATHEKEKVEDHTSHVAHPKKSGKDSEPPTSPLKGKSLIAQKESDRRPVKEDEKAKPAKPVDVKPRPPTSFPKPAIPADPPQPLPQRYAAAAAAATSVTPSTNVAISHAPTAPTLQAPSGVGSKPAAPVLAVAPRSQSQVPATSRIPQSPQRQSRNPSPQRRNPSPQRTTRPSSPIRHSKPSSPIQPQSIPSPVRTEERPPSSPISSSSPTQTSAPPVEETPAPASATEPSAEINSEMDAQPAAIEQVVTAPSTLSDLFQFYEAVKEKSSKPDSYWTQQMLDVSYHSAPDSFDSERRTPYVPRNHYPTPMYYPQVPPPHLENYAVFEKFDADCLFFIFYYMQGTYQQYLAARELKKQSWRFHKKYLTWFQRHEEPKGITDDYEQGSYVYFDYEGAWCQRKKNEFRFEYKFLEDGELI